MSSTHPNWILSVAMISMNQREYMRINPFWCFWFNHLWPFNFQFGCRPKCSNHNILVFTHPIWKLKIVLEISQSTESMVRNQFWDFECFTTRNPCDSQLPLGLISSPWPWTNIWDRVFCFSPKSSIFSWILIEVTFWLVNLENSTLSLEQPSLSQV